MYIILSLVSGIVLGLFYITKKEVLRYNDVTTVLMVYTVVGALILMVDYKVAMSLDIMSILIVFIKAFIIYISWILSGKAMKELPLSISSPLGILNPIFSVFLGIFILNEKLKILQVIGITVMFVSYYFIAKVGEVEVKNIFKNRYIYYMSISMLIGSISATIDKLLLKSISVEQLQFWYYLFLAIMYLITYFGINALKIFKREDKLKLNFSIWMIVVGVLIILADKIYFIAVKIPDANISIILPLRYISIIISAIIGGLIFKEKNIAEKFKYMIGIAAGIVLIFI